MNLCCAALAFLLVQEKVELKFQPQQGDKITTVERMTMSLKLKEGDQDWDFEQRGTEKKVRELLEVKDGKVQKITVDTRVDIEETKEPGASIFSLKENPLHATKATVTRDGDQIKVEGVETLDKKAEKSFRLEDPLSRAFPKKPVAVGDSWEVSGKVQ